MVRGFLLFFLTIAILIFPVSAVSFDNTVAVNANLLFEFSYGSNYGSYNTSISSGSTYFYQFYNQSVYNSLYGDLSFTLNVSENCDFYIVLIDDTNTAVDGAVNYSFVDLEGFRQVDKDISYSLSFSNYKHVYLSTSNTELVSSESTVTGNTRSVNVTAYYFKNVPPDYYYLYFENLDGLIVNENYGTAVQDKNFFAVGLYVTETVPPDPILDYQNGSISFTDATNLIISDTNDLVDGTSSFENKSFYLAYGEWQLDQLAYLSDDKFLDVYTSTNSGFNQQLNLYKQGIRDLDTTLTYFSNSFNAAIEKAETPEQGALINTLYQIKLNILEFLSKIKAKATLENAISDEEMQFTQDYYESESQIMAKFDIQKYKDAMTMQMWENQLDISESSTYKSYFDFLIKSDVLNFFIAIPITLILVSIILGTRIRLPDPHSSENERLKEEARIKGKADEAYSRYYNDVFNMQQGR